MKKQLTHFITVLLLVLWQQHSFAQCNINNATATPVNGVCLQDGVVNVAIPGATACGTTTSATIRESGSSTDLTFITLSNTGTGQFTALEPGSYDVYVTQGATTVGPLAVTVTSSYTPMTVTATPTNCSCSGSIEPVSINTLAGNKRVKIITTCTERIHSPLLARNYVGYQIGIRAMIH